MNRQCASSLAAIAFGAGQIASGMSSAILAGGMESLSTMPQMTKRKAFTAGKEAEDYERWSPMSNPPTPRTRRRSTCRSPSRRTVRSSTA